MADHVLARRTGRLGRLTLNRPEAINALTLPMIEEISRVLEEWEHDPAVEVVLLDGAGDRGFCAGGDIRAVYDSARGDGAHARELWRAEYTLDAYVARYPKQVVSIVDGITMGGGVGLACHRPLRIATERTVLAMPEVRLGFAPDVAGTLLLAQAPGYVGDHLALTGGRIGPYDARFCGLVDHVVRTDRLEELAKRIETEEVTTVVADLEAAEEDASLQRDLAWIAECYSADTVAEILDRLDRCDHPSATQAAKELREKAPLALTVILRAMRETRRERPSIEDVLVRDYRVMTRFLDTNDLQEGIRAAVIDKAHPPAWAPATLDEVTEEMVQRHFTPREDDLPL